MRIAAVLLAAIIVSGCGRPAEKSAIDPAIDAVQGDDAAETPQNDVRAERTSARRTHNYLRFDRGLIVDQTGFAQPVAAASLFVPYDWRVEGGVLWGREHLCTNGYNFDWRATAPDGSSGIAIFPQSRWENNSYGAGASTPGCAIAPFANARSYIEAVSERIRPGARVLEYRERPDLLADAPAPQRTPMPMGEIRTWTEAGEAIVGWNENGRAMRGSVAARVSFQSSLTDTSGMMANDPAAAFGVQPVGPTRMQSLAAFAEPGWFAFAPDGQFNEAYFEMMRRSIAPNREWANAIAGHNSRIARVALDESRKRAQMIAATNEEISRIRQETWTMRQESAERQLREFGELMKGVETYSDAGAPGGQVELDHTYKDAWRLNDGSYILSNDPMFDPNRDLQIEARRLDPVR